MSKSIQKPKSRKEHDQMKRDKINNPKSTSDNGNIIEKCRKLFKRTT